MRPKAVFPAVLAAALFLFAPGLAQGQDVPVSQAVKEGEDQAQAIRGLEFKREVPVRFLTRDELKQHLISDRDLSYPREQREQDEAVLKLLGLIGRDVDYAQLMLDLLTENISAFYQSEEDYMGFPADQDTLGPYEINAIVHESVHALQDQYFDINRSPLCDDRDGVNDLTLAGTCLLEGDASLCNTIYYTLIPEQDYRAIFDKARSIPTPVYDSAPAYVRSRLYFPYQEGLGFARRLYEGGGFAAVDRAYADPPDSSEQIIHPEKYLSGEEPKNPELPNLASYLGKGWELGLTGVAGEYHLREMLETALNEEEAGRAAAGWAGSRYYYYGNAGGDSLLTVALEWDDEAEAAEFAEAFASYAGKRLGGGGPYPSGGSSGGSAWRSWSDGDTAAALSVDGNRTDLVFTDRPGILVKAGAALGGRPEDFPAADEELAGSSNTVAAVAAVVAALAVAAAALLGGFLVVLITRRRKVGEKAD